MEIVIKSSHNANDGEFYIENELGERQGVMNYILFGSGRLVIQHTEVSRELQGAGAGGKLVDAAVDYARDKGIKIVPICPFAKKYMTQRQDQYKDVLV